MRLFDSETHTVEVTTTEKWDDMWIDIKFKTKHDFPMSNTLTMIKIMKNS